MGVKLYNNEGKQQVFTMHMQEFSIVTQTTCMDFPGIALMNSRTEDAATILKGFYLTEHKKSGMESQSIYYTHFTTIHQGHYDYAPRQVGPSTQCCIKTVSHYLISHLQAILQRFN